MYTIKQASVRTGVGIPLLRAWERRYGIPTPERTASGYRLYDERSIDRVRRMHALVDSGWSPSQAARSILEAPEDATTAPLAADGHSLAGVRATALFDVPAGYSLAGFRAAAARLDESEMERLINDAFATLGVDEALERFLLPAVASVGDAWALGELDVAAEHAATNVAMRKLAGLYDAASAAGGKIDCVIGLPPGSRHEVGALAFAVACRRAGLRVRYLGAEVPLESWLAIARAQPRATLVLAAVTSSEAVAASGVASAILAASPETRVAVGGKAAFEAASSGASILAGSLRDALAGIASIGRRGAG